MDARERFRRVTHFEKPDRTFYMPHYFWPETIRRWKKEGLPYDVDISYQYFGFDRYETMPINLGTIFPNEEEEILSDDGEIQTIKKADGAIRRETKRESSMPQWIKYPVENRKDWEELKKHLNPKSPARYPIWWDELKKNWKNRDYPLGIFAGSFYGSRRNDMGVENFSFAMYDDPDLVFDMCNYVADFVIETIHKAVDEVEIDFAWIWEDMSYKTGPLCSPEQFRKFMLPCYKKVTRFLREHGIDVILVDSDGHNDILHPLFIEGGVTGIYPLEVAAGEDAVALRKQYGKELVLIGNIDKRELAKDKKSIEKEVLSKVPWLLEQGGYIPSIDHSVPPDVSFENFLFYWNLIKQISTK